MTFYDRIIDLCVKTNINKTTLEKKLGFSQNSVNKWKTSTPSVKKVQQLADFFNVTPAYLMGFETDKPYEEKKAEAKSLVSDLTPEEIKKVQEYIVFLKSQRKK
jgi:transcriptional regulator with XRE-family HTH domain